MKENRYMFRSDLGGFFVEGLERYRGSLTLEQLILARNKIMKNAKELYEDATILYENGRFARAYFLLGIANEELGKYLLVTSATVDLVAGNIDWKRFWKAIRAHKEKAGIVEYTENMLMYTEEDCFSPLEIKETVSIFDELKMASLYSDMFENNFFLPDEIVQKSLAESYQKLTKSRINLIESINISDETIRNFKKEAVLEYRKMIKNAFEKR